MERMANPIFDFTCALRKPRTECACQAVAFLSSLSEAPAGRLSSARILAFLDPRRVVIVRFLGPRALALETVCLSSGGAPWLWPLANPVFLCRPQHSLELERYGRQSRLGWVGSIVFRWGCHPLSLG